MSKKPTAYIFGAGGTGRRLLPRIESDYEVLGFIDNNCSHFQDNAEIGGTAGKIYKIYPPEKVLEHGFDRIVIATLPGLDPLTKQLMSVGIDARAIDGSYEANV